MFVELACERLAIDHLKEAQAVAVGAGVAVSGNVEPLDKMASALKIGKGSVGGSDDMPEKLRDSIMSMVAARRAEKKTK